MGRKIVTVDNLEGSIEHEDVHLTVKNNIKSKSKVSVEGRLCVGKDIEEESHIVVKKDLLDATDVDWSEKFPGLNINADNIKSSSGISYKKGKQTVYKGIGGHAIVTVNHTEFRGNEITIEDKGVDVDGKYYHTKPEVVIFGHVKKNALIESEYPVIVKGNVEAGVTINAKRVEVEGSVEQSANIPNLIRQSKPGNSSIAAKILSHMQSNALSLTPNQSNQEVQKEQMKEVKEVKSSNTASASSRFTFHSVKPKKKKEKIKNDNDAMYIVPEVKSFENLQDELKIQDCENSIEIKENIPNNTKIEININFSKKLKEEMKYLELVRRDNEAKPYTEGYLNRPHVTENKIGGVKYTSSHISYALINGKPFSLDPKLKPTYDKTPVPYRLTIEGSIGNNVKINSDIEILVKGDVDEGTIITSKRGIKVNGTIHPSAKIEQNEYYARIFDKEPEKLSSYQRLGM